MGVLIKRLTTQRYLHISENWTEAVHNSDHSLMSYEFRVTCDPHYYGNGCANLCRPRDDKFGHYSCSLQGDRVCLPGWKGDYCTKRKYHIFLSLRSFQWEWSVDNELQKCRGHVSNQEAQLLAPQLDVIPMRN